MRRTTDVNRDVRRIRITICLCTYAAPAAVPRFARRAAPLGWHLAQVIINPFSTLTYGIFSRVFIDPRPEAGPRRGPARMIATTRRRPGLNQRAGRSSSAQRGASPRGAHVRRETGGASARLYTLYPRISAHALRDCASPGRKRHTRRARDCRALCSCSLTTRLPRCAPPCRRRKPWPCV